MDDTPARLAYAIALYELLDDQAKENKYHERVFEGSLTQLYRQLGASSTYYSLIRRLLLESGSIEILQRGTGYQDSIIKLNGLDEKILAHPLTRAPAGATLSSTDTDRRLRALEAWRETTGGLNIAEVLRNFEIRLSSLESQTGGKN